MSDTLNIMVEAKREYLGQLCQLMCPSMIETFDKMFEEAYNMSKGRKVLIMFQKLLKEVPNWNEGMSRQHTDNIANRCAWFNDLLAAVFVSCVKILSSVRLGKITRRYLLNCQQMTCLFKHVTITWPRTCIKTHTSFPKAKMKIYATSNCTNVSLQ